MKFNVTSYLDFLELIVTDEKKIKNYFTIQIRRVKKIVADNQKLELKNILFYFILYTICPHNQSCGACLKGWNTPRQAIQHF